MTKVISVKKISLAEARRLAIQVLLDAEERRQRERKAEAEFWRRIDAAESDEDEVVKTE